MICKKCKCYINGKRTCGFYPAHNSCGEFESKSDLEKVADLWDDIFNMIQDCCKKKEDSHV